MICWTFSEWCMWLSVVLFLMLFQIYILILLIYHWYVSVLELQTQRIPESIPVISGFQQLIYFEVGYQYLITVIIKANHCFYFRVSRILFFETFIEAALSWNGILYPFFLFLPDSFCEQVHSNQLDSATTHKIELSILTNR